MEEGSQLLKGTSDKFQVVESTKIVFDIEGAREIEIVWEHDERGVAASWRYKRQVSSCWINKIAFDIEGASEIETGHSLSQEHEVGLLNQKASPSLDLEETNLEVMSDVCNGQFFISSKVSIESDCCFLANKIDMNHQIMWFQNVKLGFHHQFLEVIWDHQISLSFQSQIYKAYKVL